MKETPGEYKRRILRFVRNRNPLEVQAATPAALSRLTRGVPQHRLRQRPAPGKWSVAEILAHLSEAELVGGYRLRMILGAPGTAIQAYDQDSWAKTGSYARRNPRESLALFTALRRANLALLRTLRPAEWKRHGMHAERGRESISQITRMFAGHDLNHLAQIKRILGRGNN
ncbi:MAG: DinB family protein [Candidatus Acidiferrales bacterium]